MNNPLLLPLLLLLSLVSSAQYGLENLISVGGNLWLNANQSVSDIQALSKLTTIGGYLNIYKTPVSNLDGLQNLTTIGGYLRISNNSSLQNLEGLSGLTSIPGYFSLNNNTTLTSLSGLSNLTSIGGNLTIVSNTQLSTCEITATCNFLSNPVGTITISNNATGCATQAQVETACAGLPVTLVYFTAQHEGITNRLTWATSAETQSDHFLIEHSRDAKNWQSVGIVRAMGESSTLRNYSYSHTNPASGNNYYRLRMVDRDGSYTFSQIQSLNFREGLQTIIYPNPTADFLLLQTDTAAKSIHLYDTTGRLIRKFDEKLNAPLDLRDLPAGLYHTQILHTDGSVSASQLIKH